jgi:hypothetical protein
MKVSISLFAVLLFILAIANCEKPQSCKTCVTVTYIYGEPADSVKGVYCGDDLRIDGRVVEVRKSLYYVTTCH